MRGTGRRLSMEAEDIGAQPLLALFAGYTLNGQHVPQEEFGPYDHYYAPPSFYAGVTDRYDRADRNGRQYLIGEYGAQEGNPTPTLRAAVGEAAMLTGLERNSDLVIGSMYAPILLHENDSNWPTNMVGFDTGRGYASPSYWVVHMFANNLGAQVIGARLTGAGALKHVVTKTIQGGTTTFYVKIVNTTGQIQSARLSFLGVSSIDGPGPGPCSPAVPRPATR